MMHQSIHEIPACGRCGEVMRRTDAEWFACPNGHGFFPEWLVREDEDE